METALQEISLVVFTTLAPAGVLSTAWLLVVVLAEKSAEHVQRISHWLVLPLAFSVIGLLASATHLGTPANALYVATGIGRSPLSNEVASVVVFFVLAGIFWITSYQDKPLTEGRRAWAMAAIAASLACVQLISQAYTVFTIPTWGLPQAPLTLWMNGLSSSFALAALTMVCARSMPSKFELRLFAILTAGATVANTCLLLAESHALEGIQTVTTTASDLVPAFGAVVIAFTVLEAAAVALMLAMSKQDVEDNGTRQKRRQMMALAIGAVVASCAACFIVRFCFYSMYMTLGV